VANGYRPSATAQGNIETEPRVCHTSRRQKHSMEDITGPRTAVVADKHVLACAELMAVGNRSEF